jgi:hypothetical protein
MRKVKNRSTSVGSNKERQEERLNRSTKVRVDRRLLARSMRVGCWKKDPIRWHDNSSADFSKALMASVCREHTWRRR